MVSEYSTGVILDGVLTQTKVAVDFWFPGGNNSFCSLAATDNYDFDRKFCVSEDLSFYQFASLMDFVKRATDFEEEEICELTPSFSVVATPETFGGCRGVVYDFLAESCDQIRVVTAADRVGLFPNFFSRMFSESERRIIAEVIAG